MVFYLTLKTHGRTLSSHKLNKRMGGVNVMKKLEQLPRLSVRNPLRSVSLQIKDYQVTVKVKTPVPQPNQAARLYR